MIIVRKVTNEIIKKLISHYYYGIIVFFFYVSKEMKCIEFTYYGIFKDSHKKKYVKVFLKNKVYVRFLLT